MDLDAYTQRASCDLADERVEIKKNINKLEKLHSRGTLTDTEYKEVLDIKNKTLKDKTDELIALQNADLATYKKGFAIIELAQLPVWWTRHTPIESRWLSLRSRQNRQICV